MSKMNELTQALDSLVTCGEALVDAAMSLKRFYTETLQETLLNDKDAVGLRGDGLDEYAIPDEDLGDDKEEEQPKQYTFTEVRSAFMAKSHQGFTPQVKALITKYGADKLSAVKEEDYSAIMAELEEIV